MPVPSHIIDPRTKMKARVSEFGALAVAPLEYSTVYSVKMNATNTAYTLIEPVGNHAIIITDIVMTGSKNVGVSNSLVEIYSAEVSGSLDASAGVFTSEIAKNASQVLNGLNFIIPKGRFLLSKIDDADVYIAIGYYYVPVD
jgi:hypothetical protein